MISGTHSHLISGTHRDDAGEVRYRRKPRHDQRPQRQRDSFVTLEPADFLARVIMHIPDPRRHLVRYYGWYSNVSRGKRKRAIECQSLEAHPAFSALPEDDEDRSPEARALRRGWAQMIKRVYEVDPLISPKCQAEMRIVAFILDHEVVDKILRHLEKQAAARERGPPGTVRLEVAS